MMWIQKNEFNKSSSTPHVFIEDDDHYLVECYKGLIDLRVLSKFLPGSVHLDCGEYEKLVFHWEHYYQFLRLLKSPVDEIAKLAGKTRDEVIEKYKERTGVDLHNASVPYVSKIYYHDDVKGFYKEKIDDKKNAEIAKAFERDKNTCLINGKLYNYQGDGVAFIQLKGRVVLADDMGLGKAQPLTSKILTPTGWKRMGDISVNDDVINSQGTVSKVTGVFPRGQKKIYKVKFTDGSSTECCGEHLWAVNTPTRRKRGNEYMVMSLDDLVTHLREKNGTVRYFIPIVKPVQFSKRSCLIDPYVMGLLIGDGCFTRNNVGFTTVSGELETAVRESLPPGLFLVKFKGSTCDWTITGGMTSKRNAVVESIRKLGLAGLVSRGKFIPDDYKYNSIDVRVSILQGILDTDGYVSKDNVIEYTSVSAKLMSDVLFIVRSLGGTARLSQKRTSWTYKGVKKHGSAYRMIISLPSGIKPFRLSRKVERYHDREKYQPVRAIKEVTCMGMKEARCIMTDAPNHLYVTDDFIVTHNTVQTIEWLLREKRDDKMTKAIIIVPASLKKQWLDEITKFAGDRLSALMIDGTPDKRKDLWKATVDVLICNYDLIINDLDNEFIKRDAFSHVITDEASYIKNRDAKRTIAVKRLAKQAPYRLALTGTPIENNINDLWSICDFVNPEILGDRETFRTEYAPIWKKDDVKENHYSYQGAIGKPPVDEKEEKLAELRKKLKKVMIRRRKVDVLDQLPPLVKMRETVDLDAEIMAYHDNLNTELVDLLRQYKRVAGNVNNEDTRHQQIVLSSMIIARFTYLRELCLMPELIIEGTESKNAKLFRLLEIVDEIDGGHKTVIFTEFRRVAEMLNREIPGSLIIHGKIPKNHRPGILAEFKESDEKNVLISTSVLTYGVNLQFADYIINYDLHFNPAKMAQRVDRLHRIGQERNVTVINIIANGSIEERIEQMLAKKHESFCAVIEGKKVDANFMNDRIIDTLAEMVDAEE